MSPVKSLNELMKLREKVLEERKAQAVAGNVQVIVAMGTCGIAAGAGDTMKSILNFIKTNKLSGVTVVQAGCLGLCGKEPTIQVIVGEESRVTYGKVTPEVARRILQEHIVERKIVKDFVII